MNNEEAKQDIKRMRNPITGAVMEVDMSLSALSRTMENIRKSADIINGKDTSFDTAMSRFDYIKSLVLEHAVFSPRLQNLQVKIGDKVIEVVRELDLLEQCRISYARKYFINKAEELLKKGRDGAKAALDVMDKGKTYLEKDPETQEFIKRIKAMI